MPKPEDFARNEVTKRIREALALLLEPGSVAELRIPDAPGLGVVRGYYNDLEKLARDATGWNGKAPGIYITLNPVKPDLLARSANRLSRARTGGTTPDDYITRRIWLPIDCDPVRPSGISSTDMEHQLALDCAQKAREWLDASGWPEPLYADSGNGAHLLYRINLQNDSSSLALIGRCLDVLSFQFSDPRVAVDTGNSNASRIWKMYGTWACKGDDLPERPHRISRLIEIPKTIQVVNGELLQCLAEMVPKEEKYRGYSDTWDRLDLGAWTAKYHVPVVATGPWQKGHKWIVNPCPWNSEHKDRSAYIVQFPNGAIAAGCHHNGCSNNGWKELRELYEPNRGQANDRASDSSQTGPESGVWPAPETLTSELPPVAPFDAQLLPESFRPAALDIAKRMQVPLDFPAVVLVGSLAGAVNRRAVIQPKAVDTSWVEVPNLWGGIVGPQGFMKSPVIAEGTKPLRGIDDGYRREYETQTVEFLAAKDRWELERQAYREMYKARIMKPGRPALPEPAPCPEEPKQMRLLVNDPTFESLHEIMRDNPAGLTLLRDELSGWWATLDRPGREGERAFYLQTWNGNTGHTIDRIGRGSIHVPACCLTMLGGIQPAKLRSYLVDTLKGGPTDDGLIQRFQLLVWPDLSEKWENHDRLPDSQALALVEYVLQKLVTLPMDNPLRFKFSADAQSLFNEWRDELEAKIRSADIHPALAGHLSKFRKTMPALALLFELADTVACGGFEGFVGSLQGDLQKIWEVSLVHARQAASWCDYLESHARRVYSCIVAPQVRAAHVLAGKLKAKKIGADGVFSLREVYLKGWAGLDSTEVAQGAADILHDLGWIRPAAEQPAPHGGRPSIRYEVNPRIWQ